MAALGKSPLTPPFTKGGILFTDKLLNKLTFGWGVIVNDVKQSHEMAAPLRSSQ